MSISGLDVPKELGFAPLPGYVAIAFKLCAPAEGDHVIVYGYLAPAPAGVVTLPITVEGIVAASENTTFETAAGVLGKQAVIVRATLG